MIDILKEFYNITIDNYEEVCNGIVFFVYDVKYYFYKCCLNEEEVDSIFSRINEVDNNLQLHDFVFNKEGKIYSDGFVLFKLNVFVEDVSLGDLKSFYNQKTILFDYVKMDDFWYKKIDYLEHQLVELSSMKIINCSFDYFVGIAELLLLFYKDNFNFYENDLCLSHKEFNNLSSLDFYNPLNLSFDYIYKDLISFIRLTNDYKLLNDCLNIINNNEKIYLFIRMCFPFKYFECLSKGLLENDEKLVMDLINNVYKYEEYLFYIEELFNVHLFSWIKKE